jgi:periplasmic divalent cation tolerance protein
MVTTANREEAERISQVLLKERLIACANIIGPVTSLFWWSGKVERAKEHLLLMKSRSDLFLKLSGTVKALHSYGLPEIIMLPMVQGSEAYLEWLDGNLKPTDE